MPSKAFSAGFKERWFCVLIVSSYHQVGGSFSVAPHFLGTTFARTRAFSFSIRFSAPLSSLCLLAYCKSLHTIRDGIADHPDLEKVKEISDRLIEHLPAIDPFWPRWKFFAEK